jgi:hypothetical protein
LWKWKTPGGKIRPAFIDFLAAYFLQHFAQPASSLQHFAQVAWSTQQEPSQVWAAGLEQEPQLLQPEVNNSPAAQTAPSISIFILVFPFVAGLFGCWLDTAAHVRQCQSLPFPLA